MSAFDVTVTPTVTNGAYSAGDIIGGLITIDTGISGNKPIIVNEIVVALKAAVTPSLTAILLEASPASTTTTDNAAYSLNAADVFKVRAAIPISTLYDHGTPNTYSSGAINRVMGQVPDQRYFYMLLVDATGVTLTSTSDLQVRVTGRAA